MRARHTTTLRGRRADRGVVLPSLGVLGTVLAIAIAGLALVVTRAEVPDRGAIRQVATPPQSTPAQSTPAQSTPVRPSPSAAVSLPPAIHLAPDVARGRTRVDIYNNSSVAGLADRAGARADQLGWRVSGIDNWIGAVPTSTVYYPPGLRLEATVLGDDLRVRRYRPAVDPMRTDRLTVILTGD